MKIPPKILNGEDNEKSLLLGKVKGQYRSPSGKDCIDAYLGLYLSDDEESPISYCYFGIDGSFCGHYSPFSENIQIEFALLEAWHAYEIGPHYWELSEFETEEGIEPQFLTNYQEQIKRFRIVVDFFKEKEYIRQMVYGPRDDKFNADRLFYPDLPKKPEVEYSGMIEEMERNFEEFEQGSGGNG